jgi:hypothetical protein
MHPIYPASLAAALYPHQVQSNSDRGAKADRTLMGSQRDAMISQVIADQVETYFDWGFAATLSSLLLVLALAAFVLYDRLVGLESLIHRRGA